MHRKVNRNDAAKERKVSATKPEKKNISFSLVNDDLCDISQTGEIFTFQSDYGQEIVKEDYNPEDLSLIMSSSDSSFSSIDSSLGYAISYFTIGWV